MSINKLIIAITGASGAIYGKKLLEVLQTTSIETHLIISKSAGITIASELEEPVQNIKNLADFNYNFNDISSKLCSGSFKTDGMIIAPCSINTMSKIAHGISDNQITRAADVCLKERRKLALMLRETPLHTGHIKNMLNLSEMGAVICPPVPAFYNKPTTIDEIINHSVARVLDLFDININLIERWNGLNKDLENE